MVALFGRANWWLPGWLARLLRVPAVRSQPARARRAAEPGSAEPGSAEPGSGERARALTTVS